MPRPTYHSLWHRLVANTYEPHNEQSCWWWARKLDTSGYGRVNVYVPGMGDTVILMAHIVAWLIAEFGFTSADDLFLAYLEHSASGMELDHLCRSRCCIRPDHLEHVSGSVNSQRRSVK